MPENIEEGKPRLLVISTLTDSDWSRSEELWAQAAELLLPAIDVHTYCGYQLLPVRLQRLQVEGLKVQRRALSPLHRLCVKIGRHYPAFPQVSSLRLRWLLSRVKPGFVLLNLGSHRDGEPYLEELASSGIPFSVLVHGASIADWPSDEVIRRQAYSWRKARAIHCVSEDNTSILRQHHALFGYERFKQLEFPAVTSPRMPFEWPSLNERGPQVACIGRLSFAQGGHDQLLAALATGVWPLEQSWRVHIIGGGEHRDALAYLIRQHGLEGHVQTHGPMVDTTELWERYHALLLPARSGGLPPALWEALQRGRPVFATDRVSGPVVHRRQGLVAPGSGQAALTAMLREAWSTLPEWETMGRQAYELAGARAGKPAEQLALFLREALR